MGASPITLGQACDIENIEFYCQKASGPDLIQVGIYNDTSNGSYSSYPGNLVYLASPQAFGPLGTGSLSTTNITDFPVSPTFSLPAGKYWLACYTAADIVPFGDGNTALGYLQDLCPPSSGLSQVFRAPYGSGGCGISYDYLTGYLSIKMTVCHP